MIGRDTLILIGGFVTVVILITAAIVYPLYRVGQKYERHFVWSPPEIQLRHDEEELSVQDLERLMKDPRQRSIIEGMRKMPREIQMRPIWIGSRTGPQRDWVGNTALLTTILYAGWLVQYLRR